MTDVRKRLIDGDERAEDWIEDRITKGWCDCDTWSVDMWLCDILSQMLPLVANQLNIEDEHIKNTKCIGEKCGLNAQQKFANEMMDVGKKFGIHNDDNFPMTDDQTKDVQFAFDWLAENWKGIWW